MLTAVKKFLALRANMRRIIVIFLLYRRNNVTEENNTSIIHSRFLRSCTARGSCTDLCRRGPAKVKARESILFTEGSHEVKRKSKHLFDIMITIIMVTLGAPDQGTCITGFPDYWFAPGAQPHLHVLWVTRGRKVFLKLILRVPPLKVGELKV